MHGVPLVRFECGDLQCLSCGYESYAGLSPGRFRSFGYIGVPPDPGTFVARGYPRHDSDSWRAGAKTMPRLDGVYSSATSRGEFILAMPTDDVNKCLFFTDTGDVLEFTVSYRHGLRSGRRFHEAARAALRGFDNSRATVSGHARTVMAA